MRLLGAAWQPWWMSGFSRVKCLPGVTNWNGQTDALELAHNERTDFGCMNPLRWRVSNAAQRGPLD